MSRKFNKILISVLLFCVISVQNLMDSMTITEAYVSVSKGIAIVGFQISPKIIIDGKEDVGIRTIYYTEQTIDGQEIVERGLIYGLDTGEITTKDLVIDSSSDYVVHCKATEKGKSSVKMSDYENADYYVMTMGVAGGYNQSYYVRPYAILEDGRVVYGDSEKYNIFEITKYIYVNKKMPTAEAHQSLYEKILKDSEEPKIEYGSTNQTVNIGVETKQYKYYSSLETAIGDANNMTTENSKNFSDGAVAGVYINEESNMAEVILYENIENAPGITVAVNFNINLNGKTISFKKDQGIRYAMSLAAKNGTLKFTDVLIAIDSKDSADSIIRQLNLDNVEIRHTSSDEIEGPKTIASSNITLKDTNIFTSGIMDTVGIHVYGENGSAEITNCTLETTSEQDNSFNVYASDECDIEIIGGSYKTKAEKWSMGLYSRDEGTVMNIVNAKVSALGTKYNNAAIYNASDSEVKINGGYYYAATVPVSATGQDSYGAAIFNLGKITINGKVEAIGGNSAIQCSNGSVTVINDGVFKSPNHGGIYVACGSSGKCTINGGTFICNRDDYTSNELGTIVSFGAAYFGCPEDSEQWSVDVKNATFTNEYGQGIVQKSNSGYIPPTINLYNCKIYGKTADLVIQNNDSVENYRAYINLYEGTVLTGGIINDLYRANGGKSHVADYR